MAYSIKRNPNVAASLADSDKVSIYDASTGLQSTCTMSTLVSYVATGQASDLTLVNETASDADGARSCSVGFKGTQSGGEETTLAKIQASHDGASDDQKGDLILYTNDGTDGDAPTERLRIDSAGLATFAGAVTSTGTLTATAAASVGTTLAVTGLTDLSTAGFKTKTAVTDTANPPTQAELVTAFGAAATAGAGFIGYLNDAGGGTNTYICTSDGTNWFYVLMTVGA